MKRLVIVGKPIGHSLSPAMHNAALEALGLGREFFYEKMEIEEAGLSGFAGSVRKGDIEGANVTMPYKTAITRHLDGVTPEARSAGAVNTLYRKNGMVLGHNTDGLGCVHSLREGGADPKGKKIVVIGAGGAARGIASALMGNGAKEIVILNRTEERAESLASELGNESGTTLRPGGLEKAKEELADSDILINCTSLGMKGKNENASPVTSEILREGLVVMDIVYTPLRTMLIREAEGAGCRTIDGASMLVHQGAIGFELWTGRKAPVHVMRKAVMEEIK